jgi:DNA-binding transcriptional LysR family regulator
MNRFEELQTFVRVVETGNISRAAERMNIAKSAVSRRISDLETRLDVQLFHRNTRKLNLTASGEGFYQRAVRILCDLEEAETAITQQHGTLSGVLRVAVPLSFGLTHLGPAITDFMQTHPKIEFDLDFNDRQVDLLQDGFDVGIRIANLGDSSLIARPISSIHSVVGASPGYLKQFGTPQTPKELEQHACLIYSNLADPQVWKYQSPTGESGSVKVRATLKANYGEFMLSAAVKDQGIVLQPTFIAYKAIERGELIPILTDYQWPSIKAYAIYPQTRHLSYRVRAFVDFLVERFAGQPYWDKCMENKLRT